MWAEVQPSFTGYTLPMRDHWHLKADVLKRFNTTFIVFRGLLLQPTLHCHVGDAEAARACFRDGQDFCKPVERYDIIDFYGPNILITEHERWRRHLRLTIGSFNERNNQLVWDESQRLLHGGLCQALEHDATQDDIGGRSSRSTRVEDSLPLTMRLALAVFSSAALGISSDWPRSNNEAAKVDASDPNVHFFDLLNRVFEGILVRIITPAWAYKVLPLKRIQEVDKAYKELDVTLRGLRR